MGGEFQDVEENMYGYSMARGLFFDDDRKYVIEVYGGGDSEDFGINLKGPEGESVYALVYNQPEVHGAGVNRSLSMSSDKASLPKSDEEIEAFARYALQEEVEESLGYKGPRDLNDIEY